MKNVAIIMAGGKGERFWPMSRENMPKQFLKLVDSELTMIQLTVKRILKIVNEEDIYVVTSQLYKKLVYEQLPNLKKENILFEPRRRNTAPCLGYAAAVIKKRYADANLIILASDNVIVNNQLFTDNIKLGIECAQNDNIVTLGIVPTYPETGYGYIKLGSADNSFDSIYKVDKFVEKPNLELAKEYCTSGDYLWNSGMFICKNEVMYNSIKKFIPELFKKVEKIYNSVDTDDFESVVNEMFDEVEPVSIDYGVMEKAENIYVIPGNFGWDDVGSWLSVERLNNKDENNNVAKGNIVKIDSNDNILINDTDKLVATLGIENLVVVNTENAILIMSKDKTSNIKELISKINTDGDNKKFL